MSEKANNGLIFDSNRGTTLTSETLFSASYDGKENQMTCALLKVIQAGGAHFLHYFVKEITSQDSIPENFLKVRTQLKADHSKAGVGNPVCDGVIETIPFKLFIESKIDASAGEKQLEKYEAVVEESRKKEILTLLLYITADKERPAVLDKAAIEDCIWQSWTDILKILNEYCRQNPLLTHMAYMTKGLRGLWNELTYKPNNIPADKLVAVVAGRVGYPRAKDRKIYNCQAGRNFRNAPYLAFYAEGKISKVFRIKEGPFQNNGKYPDLPAGDDFYKLELLDDVIQKPLVNTERDRRGNLKAFTMGPTRYVNFDTLSEAKDITDLKKRNHLK